MSMTEKLSDISEALTSDFCGSSDAKKPQRRSRMKPEVRDANNVIIDEAKPYTVSRTQYAAEWARYAINNRPSTFEATTWLMMRAPFIVFGGALAVHVADKALGLGIADDLASVRVDEDAHPVVQIGQDIVHEVGETAQEM